MTTSPRTTGGRGRLYDSILDTIGDTPCVRINTLAPDHVRLYVKAEFFNPAGSVKDRLAVSIIEEAERSGALTAGTNRGRSDQRQHGHRSRHGLCRQGLSPGRHHGRQLLHRAPQADALSRRQSRTDTARRERLRHVPEGEGTGRGQWLVPGRPVRDDANALIHEHTTGPEILADFAGERLDYWVTGYGTGGTVTGVARVLRKERPDTKIILTEPANAQLLGSGVARSGPKTTPPQAVIRPGNPTRSRAGRPISFPTYCRRPSTRHGFRRADPGRRAGRDRVVAQARSQRGHLHRYFRRLHLCGVDADRRKGGTRDR